MLAYIGTGSQHPGCGFQLINQNSVIVFAAREVNGFTSGDVQCLKMRSGDMNDIQRRQRLLPDGNKFGSQAVTPCGGRGGHIAAGL